MQPAGGMYICCMDLRDVIGRTFVMRHSAIILATRICCALEFLPTRQISDDEINFGFRAAKSMVDDATTIQPRC